MVKSTESLTKERILLVGMGLFQVVWLVMRWVLMPDPDWTQLVVMVAFAIGAASLTLMTPQRWGRKLRELRHRLVESERLLLLVLCVVVLAAGAVHASQRRFHGDEPGSYNAATVVATRGVTAFFREYKDIPWLGIQHPPLTSLIYGVAMRLLGMHLATTRAVTLLFTAATIVVTYQLGVELYDKSVGLTAALLMLSFPYSLHMGTMANNDLPATFFFSLSMLLLIRLFRAPTYSLSVAIGLVIGAGLLTKYTVTLVYGVALLCVMMPGTARRSALPHLAVGLLISAGILAIWLIYASQIGVLSEQIDTLAGYAGISASQDGGILLAERKWKLEKRIETLFARLPSAVGAFSIPILLASGWRLAHRRDQSDLVSLAWVAAVSLPVALILPDPRYFLLAFPALAILMAGGVHLAFSAVERFTMLALLYGGQALYLYLVLTQAARILEG